MRVCVSCEKEIPKGGFPVKDDKIIQVIRSIKRKLNIAKDNELVVCDSCKVKHATRRSQYERSLPIWIGVAVLCFLGLTVLPLLSGSLSISSIIIGILFAGLLLFFAVVLRYVPAMKGE